jgi:structural maintenance of chromosome 3 (chondroitin sulfate proteoglycan 6)
LFSFSLFSQKKDEFFLNRKRITKAEVVSLLESAGFSRSNPYYIVEQGKISALCTINDKERLALLKEVAGTTVYEERRSESVKIIGETAGKKEKVEEVLSFLEERLSELDKEKEELTEFESLDKQRRALEYTLYDKEHALATAQLAEIDKEREITREEQHSLFAITREIQDEMVVAEETLGIQQAAKERLQVKKETQQAELRIMQNRKLAVETEISERESALHSIQLNEQELQRQSQDIDIAIQEGESELNALLPHSTALSLELAEEIEHLSGMRLRLDALYAKQGRGSHFHSSQERDNFLNQQIQLLAQQIQKKKLALTTHTEELTNLNATIQLQVLYGTDELHIFRLEFYLSFAERSINTVGTRTE